MTARRVDASAYWRVVHERDAARDALIVALSILRGDATALESLADECKKHRRALRMRAAEVRRNADALDRPPEEPGEGK